MDIQHGEDADQRHRDGAGRDQRRAPVLQEQIDHRDHQQQRDRQRRHDLGDVRPHEPRRVIHHGVLQPLRKAFGNLLHLLLDRRPPVAGRWPPAPGRSPASPRETDSGASWTYRSAPRARPRPMSPTRTMPPLALVLTMMSRNWSRRRQPPLGDDRQLLPLPGVDRRRADLPGGGLLVLRRRSRS